MGSFPYGTAEREANALVASSEEEMRLEGRLGRGCEDNMTLWLWRLVEYGMYVRAIGRMRESHDPGVFVRKSSIT